MVVMVGGDGNGDGDGVKLENFLNKIKLFLYIMSVTDGGV